METNADKQPPFRHELWCWMVYAIKNGIKYRAMLNPDEQGFIDSLCENHARYGRWHSLTIKQWRWLEYISRKLCLSKQPPAADHEFRVPKDQTMVGEFFDHRDEIPF